MGQTLGQVIREGRVAKKMTQRQLAEKIKKKTAIQLPLNDPMTLSSTEGPQVVSLFRKKR
jgi:transcriptional regulator with XRE-family HTH domain